LRGGLTRQGRQGIRILFPHPTAGKRAGKREGGRLRGNEAKIKPNIFQLKSKSKGGIIKR